MKKLLIATTLLTLTTASAFAAPSGTLLLKGRVGRVLDISVAAEGVAQLLDLSVTQTDLKVATVNEQSNVALGYKVTITSANLGNLKRGANPEVFAYTMKYGNSAVTLSGSGTEFVTAASSLGTNVNKEVKISYTGKTAVSMIEGDYTDTVTFTIASN